MVNKNSNSNLEMIKDKFKLVQDINALESDILQDDDYVKRYYLVDDAIRNKGSLTLIARPYITKLSILSQCLSEKYKLYESLQVTSQNVNRNVLKEITNGIQLSYMNTLVNTSKYRVIEHLHPGRGPKTIRNVSET